MSSTNLLLIGRHPVLCLRSNSTITTWMISVTYRSLWHNLWVCRVRARNRCRFSLKCKVETQASPHPSTVVSLTFCTVVLPFLRKWPIEYCICVLFVINLNITITYHIMSILLRRLPFQRTLQQRYRSCECPENSNILSTTFKVNVCMLFCTNVICSSIKLAVHTLKEDRMECEKRWEKRCEKRLLETK